MRVLVSGQSSLQGFRLELSRCSSVWESQHLLRVSIFQSRSICLCFLFVWMRAFVGRGLERGLLAVLVCGAYTDPVPVPHCLHDGHWAL